MDIFDESKMSAWNVASIVGHPVINMISFSKMAPKERWLPELIMKREMKTSETLCYWLLVD